jgi:hypothetical protein
LSASASLVDDPLNTDRVRTQNKALTCRTSEPDLQCQDCRETDLQDIYTAHFTVCGKPQWCPNPTDWWTPNHEDHHRLCMELFREWHTVRLSLEDEWKGKYSDYKPTYSTNVKKKLQSDHTNYSWYYLNFSQGHCRRRSYIQMEFPSVFYNRSAENLI